jgi:hypothetical protein
VDQKIINLYDRFTRRAGRRGVVPQVASGIDRQGRSGRLLLRGRTDQSAGGGERRARCGGCLLRKPDPGGPGPAIKAPLLLHYAGNDERTNAGIAAYEAALKANNKKYTIHMYPGVQHAFNNDTGAARYDKAAAELAFGRTLAFFAENLGAPPKAA